MFLAPSTSLFCEEPLRVAKSDSLGGFARQLRKPGAVPGDDLSVSVPALGDPGVRAEQEAVGIFFEQAPPLRREPAVAAGAARAIRELASQRGIALEIALELFRRGAEAGVRPDDFHFRVVREQPLDRLVVRMRMDDEVLRHGEIDDALHLRLAR